MKVEIKQLGELDKGAWEKLVRGSHAGPYQSWQYAGLMEKMFGYKAWFVLLSDEGNGLVAGMAFHVGTVPKRLLAYANARAIAKRILDFAMPAASAFDAPVTLRGREALAAKVLEGFDGFCREKGIRPREIHTNPNCNKEVEGFVAAKGYSLKGEFTPVVELWKPLDAIYESLPKKGRKAVRDAEQLVEVRPVKGERGIEEYFRMFDGHRRRLGLYRTHPGDLKLQWETLHPADMFQVFTTYSKKTGKPLAAMGAVYYNGAIVEVMSAQSDGQNEADLEEKRCAGDMLKWAIIKFGNAKGIREYDLGGISPDPQTPKERGIAQFKRKFSENVVKGYLISMK